MINSTYYLSLLYFPFACNVYKITFIIYQAFNMDDIIVNIETLLCEFQVKFKELEDIVYITNQQFNRLKVEYVKSVPIAKGSVMSMKDFVSYMSTLEDVENEETSQNISELPYDDNDTPEPIKPDIVEEPLFNQNNI